MRLVLDIDGTLTNESNDDYPDKLVNMEVLETLRRYKAAGFTIVLFTSRNMRSFRGNIGLINVNTLPGIVEWLNRNGIPFDEIYVGKPWCGEQGFYVDDKAIRPDEFAKLTYKEICKLLKIRPSDVRV